VLLLHPVKIHCEPQLTAIDFYNIMLVKYYYKIISIKAFMRKVPNIVFLRSIQVPIYCIYFLEKEVHLYTYLVDKV
jgi:hypothetical protein